MFHIFLKIIIHNAHIINYNFPNKMDPVIGDEEHSDRASIPVYSRVQQNKQSSAAWLSTTPFQYPTVSDKHVSLDKITAQRSDQEHGAFKDNNIPPPIQCSQGPVYHTFLQLGTWCHQQGFQHCGSAYDSSCKIAVTLTAQQCFGSIQVLPSIFFWKFDVPTPTHKANNIEPYTFVKLICVDLYTPPPPIAVTLECPLLYFCFDMMLS